MRKLLFPFCLLTLCLLAPMKNMNAQNGVPPKFGIILGYALISVGNDIETTSQSGFFVGGTLDFELGEKWALVPKVLYANYSDVGFLHAPIYAQYEIVPNLGIQAGPQISVVLDDPFNSVNEFGIDIGFGLNYDFSEKVYINARYALELTDRTNEDSFSDSDETGTLGFDTFMFGIGYRF